MSFGVNRKLLAPSSCVFGVDFHSTEPWLLTSLKDGTVRIYCLKFGAVIRTLEVTNVAVPCVKFINGKNWFVAGLSNGQLRVFNYNTNEKVAVLEAHTDRVSCLTVHPTASIVLTGSNDKTVKAWDWDKQWHNIQIYQGHAHWIVNIAFDPKDSNNFVSASFDGTVKMWSMASSVPRSTVQSHNHLHYAEFYPGPDKSHLVTTSSNNTLEVWNYRSNSRVQTMHTADYANFAVFHPKLPLIISGGSNKDGTVKIWNTETYKIELTLNCSLGEARCVAFRKETNEVAVAFMEGVVTFELHRKPIFSMDLSNKLFYMRNRKVLSADLGTLTTSLLVSSPDGARISLQTEICGSISINASSLLHSPNNRSVTIVGDGEYIIYTAHEWRKESSGVGTSFAWAPDSNTYAVLKSEKKLRFYKKGKGKDGGKLSGKKGVGNSVIGALYTGLAPSTSWFRFENPGKFVMESLHTGPVLGAQGPGYVVFLDWETGDVVKKIDIDAKNIFWSTTGTHVAITSSGAFYIFYFDLDAYHKKRFHLENFGLTESFTLISIVPDIIQSAKWIGDCLMYTTPTQLRYSICYTEHFGRQGIQSYTISSLANNKFYLLGCVPEHEKVYLVDESMRVYGFGFSLVVVEFQAAVLREDIDGAKELFTKVPKEHVDKITNFLEGRATHPPRMKEIEESVISEIENRFENVISLDELGANNGGNNESHRDEVDPYKQCVTLAMKLLETKATSDLISELRDEKAQDMVNLLSKMVDDEDTFTQRERRRSLHILSKLAKSAEIFPQSLELEDVQCNLTNIVAAGGYGFIYKGIYEGSPVCVKAVSIDSRGIDRKKLRAHTSELIIWAHLSHPNVLPFLGIYLSNEKVPRACIISPWMDNGDLLQYLQKVPDVPRKPIVRDIVSGLQYLHDFDIIHADLKAKNVLVSATGGAMLADFGISRLSMTRATTLTSNFVGSVCWMAPELLLDYEPPSHPSDIWALGCTCYEIITGETPFSQYDHTQKLRHAFRKGDIIPLKPAARGVGWDEDVWSVAMRCWKSEPASRPGFDELFDIINNFYYLDDRSSTSGSKITRSSVEIDYARIFTILDEIHQSPSV